jgi:monoamine oxidase
VPRHAYAYAYDRGMRRGRSPRTPGIREARRMFAAHAEAERRRMPVEELLGEGQERRALTRRGFLVGGAGVLAGAALAAGPARSAARRPPAGAPRIAIVGAGLAGLRCAHLLWGQGMAGALGSTVYEANADRSGGRCWALRDFFGAGSVAEHGGSFIDTRHHAIRRLVAQLGLTLEVVGGGDLPLGEEIYWIDGGYYTRAEATADWKSFGYHAFRAASRKVRSEAGEEALDALSVPEWLDSSEIGSDSRLGKLMLANAVTENGGEPDDMSALDLIEITAPSVRSTLELLPGDDERFHVIGGNDQIISRMIAQLPAGSLKNGWELVALRENADRTTTLSFDVGASTVDVVADYAVLALPFSTLRNVDLSSSGLSAVKQNVIQTFGMGSNAKVHVQLRHKTWPALGFSGATYSDWDSYCCAWDDSVPLGPNGGPAQLLAFPGGHVGRTGLSGQAHGPAPAADVRAFLSQIEPVYPGTASAYTGLAYEDHWVLDPWVLGAYSYCRVGQASGFGHIAGIPEGRIHFAGEHTSVEHQGFLDGAVSSGERAARQLQRALTASRR